MENRNHVVSGPRRLRSPQFRRGILPEQRDYVRLIHNVVNVTPIPASGCYSSGRSIDSLTAALAKLKVKIKIEGLIKVVHDEDEVKRVKIAAETTQRRGALSKRESAPNFLPT